MREKSYYKILELIKDSPTPLGAAYLSKQTGIPPATVGRMLAKMEKQNLVEKVSNRGRQITLTGEKYLNSLSFQTQSLDAASELIELMQDDSKERLQEVLYVRKLLEPKAAEIATMNATESDISTLEDILLDYAYEVKHGMPDSESDMNLHLYIAKMSGNMTIYHILKLIFQDDNTYSLLTAATSLPFETRLQQHRDIINAIKERQPLQASAMMEKHLEIVMQNLSSLPDKL